MDLERELARYKNAQEELTLALAQSRDSESKARQLLVNSELRLKKVEKVRIAADNHSADARALQNHIIKLEDIVDNNNLAFGNLEKDYRKLAHVHAELKRSFDRNEKHHGVLNRQLGEQKKILIKQKAFIDAIKKVQDHEGPRRHEQRSQELIERLNRQVQQDTKIKADQQKAINSLRRDNQERQKLLMKQDATIELLKKKAEQSRTRPDDRTHKALVEKLRNELVSHQRSAATLSKSLQVERANTAKQRKLAKDLEVRLAQSSSEQKKLQYTIGEQKTLIKRLESRKK